LQKINIHTHCDDSLIYHTLKEKEEEEKKKRKDKAILVTGHEGP
jgi:hypothetical protein